jgi:hypothetical protein
MPSARDIDVVKAALRQAIPGWTLQQEVGGGVDVAGLAGRRRVHARVMSLSAGRVDDVISRLALGVVQGSELVPIAGTVVLTCVVLPRLGKRIVAEAEAFMARYGKERGWALVDRDGDARVVIPQFGVEATLRQERVAAREPRLASTPFSDLGLWMLKILLLRDAPAELWQGPRERPAHPTALARLAGVSVVLAHRFVTTLESQDFLRKRRDGLHVVRRDALLTALRQHEEGEFCRPVLVRRLGGLPLDVDDIASADRHGDLVVGGFEACRRLGVLHVLGELRVEIHALAQVEAVLERSGLERCEAQAAGVWLIPSRHPQSIRRGMLDREGVQVVDGLQAALDVLHHPGRGQEQSDYLFERLFPRREES